ASKQSLARACETDTARHLGDQLITPVAKPDIVTAVTETRDAALAELARRKVAVGRRREARPRQVRVGRAGVNMLSAACGGLHADRHVARQRTAAEIGTGRRVAQLRARAAALAREDPGFVEFERVRLARRRPGLSPERHVDNC